MDMPKLVPIRIKTKGKPFLIRLWRWMTVIREWEVVEDWEYDLPSGPRIVIPKGFIFDGASIPRPLWFLLSPTGLLLIPGLIHDFGYRYDYVWAVDPSGFAYKDKVNVGQKHWDAVFRRVGLEVNGMPMLDTIAWVALAMGGWWAWKSKRKQYAQEIKPKHPIRTTP